MPSNLHTHDLVLQLKTIKEERHLSLQDIEGLLKEKGYLVSPNSIRKVFLPGSENMSFRYHDTLEPIENTLLPLYDDQGDTEALALKAALAVKEELLERREREILDLRTESLRMSEFLTNQIKLKDDRIDKLMRRVDEVLASNRELLQQIQRLLEKL
jgi:hypothetical protein